MHHSTLTEYARCLYGDEYRPTPACDRGCDERRFVEDLTFADADAILPMLRELSPQLVDGNLPVWIRNLAYRLVLLQRPDEPDLLREASQSLFCHGPDWDDVADGLMRQAAALEGRTAEQARHEVSTDDRRFPDALAAALAVPFDYDGGDGIDFEPFPAFLSAEDTGFWWRAWTGNEEADGGDLRVFGQDGSGGYAAFWRARPGRPLAEQPVVFLGSEGEIAVVARDLGAFLWLLAGGLGPGEAAAGRLQPGWAARPRAELLAVAEKFAPERRQSVARVIEEAAAAFPGFGEIVGELCR